MPDSPPHGDGNGFARSEPSVAAAGHAALWLAESLIHHLISIKVLSVAEGIEIIDVAAEVEREVSLSEHDGFSSMRPQTSLAAMADSLRSEL